MVPAKRQTTLRRVLAGTTIAVATAGALAAVVLPAQARQTPHRTSTIRHETHHDVSQPLADMDVAPLRSERAENEPVRKMPNRPGGIRRDPARPAAAGTSRHSPPLAS